MKLNKKKRGRPFAPKFLSEIYERDMLGVKRRLEYVSDIYEDRVLI